MAYSSTAVLLMALTVTCMFSHFPPLLSHLFYSYWKIFSMRSSILGARSVKRRPERLFNQPQLRDCTASCNTDTNDKLNNLFIVMKALCRHSKRSLHSQTWEHVTEGTVQWAWQARVISQQDSSFFKLFFLLIVFVFQEEVGTSRVQMPEKSLTLPHNLWENKAHLLDDTSVTQYTHQKKLCRIKVYSRQTSPPRWEPSVSCAKCPLP